MTNQTSLSPDNKDSETYWNSPAGRKWVEHQEELDILLSEVSGHLLDLADLARDQDVLDVGCGTGETTLEIAGIVGPGGSVVGADISELLLSVAKTRLTALPDAKARFLKTDVQVHDFGKEAFDRVTSRFGVMFFGDPAAAFANMARSLRPGGQVAFASWTDFAANPWFSLPREVAEARLGALPPADPTAPGPFAFADAERVLRILAVAGLRDAAVDTRKVTLTYRGTAEEASILASGLGTAVRVMQEYDGTEEDAAAIQAGIAEKLVPFEKNGELSIPALVNFYSARKA